jgi:hypothetical protein
MVFHFGRSVENQEKPMRARVFSVFFAAVVILGATAYVNAAQTNATPTPAAPAGGSQSDDPTKKLGAFVGKWETEGAFTGGQKTSTSLECRWSPKLRSLKWHRRMITARTGRPCWRARLGRWEIEARVRHLGSV